jgi:uncharacterized damage-inducible protein DinB
MSTTHAYRGARALILLHATHMRDFLAVWKRAQAVGVAMPATEDPSYESLETLLRHVLRAARGYMTWTCEVLDLPDPDIRPTPADDAIESAADAYLEHVLERWQGPLCDVAPERFEDQTYAARWGVKYSIDAMLEHAVMHPIRHSFQLEEWLQEHES